MGSSEVVLKKARPKSVTPLHEVLVPHTPKLATNIELFASKMRDHFKDV